MADVNVDKLAGFRVEDEKLKEILSVDSSKLVINEEEAIKVGNKFTLERMMQAGLIKIKEREFLFEDFNKFTNYLDIADTFLNAHPIYYDANKIWWIWDKKEFCWLMVDETDLMNAIDAQTKNPSTNASIKNEILEALRRRGRLRKPEDNKASWVQFKDKIIDLETNEEIKASPKYFITNPINWELGTTEDTPEIDKLFVSWVGEEHKQELYELIAFCLVPHYFIHRLVCLIGSGANGKSTYLKILGKIIGNENITSSSLELLIRQRFEGSKLFKKLVCLMGETNFNLLNNTDFLKKLTGQDYVRCEFKGVNGFDFVNYAKLIIATNSLPPTTDKTEGFYRRWKIIDFPNKFPKEADILKNVPEAEYNNLCLKCLNILKKLWNERTFTNDGDFETRRKRYEEKSNPLVMFIKEKCETSLNAKILFSELYDNFKEFLAERGMRDLSAVVVSQQLKNEGYEIKTAKTKDEGGEYTTARFVFGMNFKGLTGLTGLTDFILSSHTREMKLKVDKPIKPIKLPSLEEKETLKVEVVKPDNFSFKEDFDENEDFEEPEEQEND